MGTRTLDMDKVLILIAAVYAAPFPEGDQAPYGQPPAPYGPQPRPYGPTQKYEPAPIPYKPAPAPYQPAPAPYKPAPAPYKPAPAPYKPEPAPVYKVEEEEEYAPQPYKYEYGVQDDYTNAAFAKSESQNEVGTVTGSYKVNLPDGRIQTVTYTADEVGGFKAEVTYEGTPIYHRNPKRAMVYTVAQVLLNLTPPPSTILNLCTTVTPYHHKSIYPRNMYQIKFTGGRQS